MCGHTVVEDRIYGSAEFTAPKKKTEFKYGAAHKYFKHILIDNVGPRPSSELMKDLTVQSSHCFRKKTKTLF